MKPGYTLYCECSHQMNHPFATLEIICQNVNCEHYGVRYKLPAVELEPVEEEPQQEALDIASHFVDFGKNLENSMQKYLQERLGEVWAEEAPTDPIPVHVAPPQPNNDRPTKRDIAEYVGDDFSFSRDSALHKGNAYTILDSGDLEITPAEPPSDEYLANAIIDPLNYISITTPCPDCNGEGKYHGLNTIEDCGTCGGTGRV